jgi:hypothetical protein
MSFAKWNASKLKSLGIIFIFPVETRYIWQLIKLLIEKDGKILGYAGYYGNGKCIG